jgi:hypothetical protein
MNMEVFNVKDIPRMIKVLENIERIYDAFSKSLPSSVGDTLKNEKKTEAQRLNYFLMAL